MASGCDRRALDRSEGAALAVAAAPSPERLVAGSEARRYHRLMSVPGYEEVMLPLLRTLADGEDHDV
jgi:hypothetical protein